MPSETEQLPIVVLASGRGSNFQILGNRSAEQDAPFRVGGLICNRPEAPVVIRARQRSIPVDLVDDRGFPDRPAFDAALHERLQHYPGHLIVLAGFMRILGDELVNRYTGRMINLHPSLLPKYTGLDTHRRAIEAGDPEHGATVHYVTPDLDAGPVISQTRLPIPESATPEQLARELEPRERRLLLKTVELIAAGRIQWRDGHVVMDDAKLDEPIQID